jgi:hypothetical protein
MAFDRLMILLSRLFLLFFRFFSHLFHYPYLTILVLFRVAYHLPRVLLLQSQSPQRPSPQSSNNSSPTPTQTIHERNRQLEGLKPYVYEPLSGDRTIRLLKFIASNDPGVDAIECELITFSLDYPLGGLIYRAISYTWENQPSGRLIICSGKKLAVTKNCDTVLRQLAKHAKFPVWIDAICIDQSSMAEKSMQVPLMAEIYSKAYIVYVWLGNSTISSRIIFSYTWLLWCCMQIPIKSLERLLQRYLMNIFVGK